MGRIGVKLMMMQVQRLEELKAEMEVANQEYREALAQAGQLRTPLCAPQPR